MPNAVNATLSEIIVDAANSGGDPSIISTLEALTTTELATLDGITATTSELNIMDGVTSTTAELNMLDDSAKTVTVAIAASATTDGMDITITAKDAADATLDAVHALEVWMSEDASGIGLTADTYSGDLTASVGSILTALTAKKHWSVVTAATGIFTGTLVDSANPADQYVAVKNPFNGKVVVSAVSGTNWEGV